VTHKEANKGAVVEFLSCHLGVPTAKIATIGDQPNDVLMFKRSGFSIAMIPMGSRGRPVVRRTLITTRVSPRRWNASFQAPRIEVRHGQQ
jgi:hypothetical protein